MVGIRTESANYQTMSSESFHGSNATRFFSVGGGEPVSQAETARLSKLGGPDPRLKLPR